MRCREKVVLDVSLQDKREGIPSFFEEARAVKYQRDIVDAILFGFSPSHPIRQNSINDCVLICLLF